MPDNYYHVWKDNLHLMHTGTRESTEKFLKNNVSLRSTNVEVELPGGSNVPANSFLESIKIAEEAKIHARNTTVLQLVTSAMRTQDRATHYGDTDGMDLVAKKTAEEIVKLFEGE